MGIFEQCFPIGKVGPFLLISVVLVADSAGGAVARILRWPGITGNILVGVLIGSLLTTPDGGPPLHGLQTLSTLAMGLITVIALFEVAGTVTLVLFVSRLFGASWPTALLLGTISAATAPGTIVALIRENRGKGSFVKTLVSVVALDNILCIFLFAIAKNLISSYTFK